MGINGWQFVVPGKYSLFKLLQSPRNKQASIQILFYPFPPITAQRSLLAPD
ncbi:MAG: hypothetical protein IPM82_10660 [Saprospiraceae bacterium]|nr:hypothetical protein [Saprospiraceae bacterium]